MKLRARFRVRVLLHGVALLVLMATLITLGERFIVNPSMQDRTRGDEAWVDTHSVTPPLSDQVEIARQLRVANEKAHLALTVYDADGALVASNVEPPLAAPPPDAKGALAAGEPYPYERLLAAGVFDHDAMIGVVVSRRRERGPPLSLVLLIFASCGLAAIFAAIPLSRSVVEPLETLLSVVRRFGGGNLSVRSDMDRSDEIGDLALGFDQMAARIESYVRAEKELLANVSHELRTPLARIRVVLELASDGDASRVRVYLGEIAQDLAELERLVQDVITMARLDLGASGGGRVPLRWETIDPMRLVETSRARFESLHPGHTLELRAQRVPTELRCDPILLRRAIDNLLDNAVKYAPDSRVELLVDTEDEKLCIEVMDLGPGMTPEQAARAFDPFFRADANRGATPGVGLGLSIVRRVIDAHGGTLDMETAPGRGTSITARIPLDGGA